MGRNTSRFAVRTVFVAILLAMMLLLQACSSKSTPSSPDTSTLFDCRTVTEIPKAECKALVALYSSLGGETYWPPSSGAGWLKTNAPCYWDQAAVQCENGHVVSIRLAEKGLMGMIPPEIGNLTNLQTLDLNSNRIGGNIPPEIGNLVNLQDFNLSNNQLSGSIPPEIGNLVNVQDFDLSNNQLSGSIPPHLGNLVNVQRLDLRNNHLSGSFPLELVNLAKDSLIIALIDNELSGSIPPGFCGQRTHSNMSIMVDTEELKCE